MPKGLLRMAKRLREKHQDEVRQKIQASQLINRLQNYALANLAAKNAATKVMSDGQVRAALGLLKKSVPDLANFEMTGPGGGALVVEITRFADQAPK